jgi:hypothetical protein
MHMKARTLSLLLLLLSAAALAGGCGGASGKAHSKAHQKGDGRQYSETAAQAAARKTGLLRRLGAAGPAATGVGCTITTPRRIKTLHEDGITPDEWNTDPPSSGPHNTSWADFGRFDKPVPDANVVHNLEHGGVAIWFGPQVPLPTVDAIDARVLKKGRKVLLVPRDQLGGDIVATAWGQQLRCKAASLAKLRADGTALTLDSWYDATNSQGEKNEKDIPAFAGPLASPKPVHNISLPRPKV